MSVHTVNAARRLRAEGVEGVTVNSLHPGYVRTDLPRYMPLLHRLVVILLSFVAGKVCSALAWCHSLRQSTRRVLHHEDPSLPYRIALCQLA